MSLDLYTCISVKSIYLPDAISGVLLATIILSKAAKKETTHNLIGSLVYYWRGKKKKNLGPFLLTKQ